MNEEIRRLALRIASATATLEGKEKMLRHLIDGKPPFYIEAHLDGLLDLLFVGFEPAPEVLLSDFVTKYGTVVPREIFPSDAKAQSYIDTIKKLKAAADGGKLNAIVRRKTPWTDCYYRIIWYDYFTDRVSLKELNEDGYVIVPRKELLNGSGDKQVVTADQPRQPN